MGRVSTRPIDHMAPPIDRRRSVLAASFLVGVMTIITITVLHADRLANDIPENQTFGAHSQTPLAANGERVPAPLGALRETSATLEDGFTTWDLGEPAGHAYLLETASGRLCLAVPGSHGVGLNCRRPSEITRAEPLMVVEPMTSHEYQLAVLVPDDVTTVKVGTVHTRPRRNLVRVEATTNVATVSIESSEHGEVQVSLPGRGRDG